MNTEQKYKEFRNEFGLIMVCFLVAGAILLIGTSLEVMNPLVQAMMGGAAFGLIMAGICGLLALLKSSEK